ncbi:hypothetical protein B4Q13_25285, partial [Lacticaseibacillus rhamnosus]
MISSIDGEIRAGLEHAHQQVRMRRAQGAHARQQFLHLGTQARVVASCGVHLRERHAGAQGLLVRRSVGRAGIVHGLARG